MKSWQHQETDLDKMRSVPKKLIVMSSTALAMEMMIIFMETFLVFELNIESLKIISDIPTTLSSKT